jgi:hypothetical protein
MAALSSGAVTDQMPKPPMNTVTSPKAIAVSHRIRWNGVGGGGGRTSERSITGDVLAITQLPCRPADPVQRSSVHH